MGDDQGAPEERPAHRVTLSAYYIDQHEVTVRQYDLYEQSGGAKQPNGGNGRRSADRDLPKCNVTYNDAKAYAEWAGKALPSEAQWEFAARTVDSRIHPWGNSEPAWSRKREAKQIDPVMNFPTDLSPYGIFDLAGNAWEWTDDLFSTRYFSQFRGKEVKDPTGPTKVRNPPQRTVKGGSKEWLSSWRTGMSPTARTPYLGFRCALQADQPVPTQNQNVAPAPAPGAPPQGKNANTPMPF
jgi:formylglycine-generating enzyme required for sulfatase activity